MIFVDFHKEIPKILPDIIEANVEIYGEKHKDTISNRLNNTIFLNAYTPQNLAAYIEFLKDCKKRQLSVQFLEYVCKNICDIGSDNINFEFQHQQGYAEPLDKSIVSLLSTYIKNTVAFDQSYWPFCDSGIFLWMDSIQSNEDPKSTEEQRNSNRVEFLNFMRGNNTQPITVDNLEEFYTSEEYTQLRQKIKMCIQKFLELVEEYNSFVKQEITPLEQYSKKEIEHLRKFERNEVNTIFETIFPQLPVAIQEFLGKFSSIDEKIKALFGIEYNIGELGFEFFLESFSSEAEKTIIDKSDKYNDLSKMVVYLNRIKMFKSLGLDIDIDTAKGTKKTVDDFKQWYEQCLEMDGAKDLIIPSDVADQITVLRKEAYERYKKEKVHFHCCIPALSDEGNGNLDNQFQKLDSLIDYLSRIMDMANGNSDASRDFSISCDSGEEINAPFLATAMIFLGGNTIQTNIFGSENFFLLHETGHAFEYRLLNNEELKSGLNISVEYQQYNKDKRKYERINETLRDIRSIKVYRKLRDRGVKLVSRYEFTDCDEHLNNLNTHHIVKDLLAEFENNYSDAISDALLNDVEPLFDLVRKRKF